MTDSVNLNPFIKSLSPIEYKEIAESNNSNNTKETSKEAYVSEDEEYGLIEEGTFAGNSNFTTSLENCIENLIKSFEIDANLKIGQQAANISNINWDSDNQILGLQNELSNAKNEYSKLIEKYKDEFVEQYTGDGKNLETEFISFLMSKDDYKALTQKYDQTQQYNELHNKQNEYDQLNAELEVLEKSGKNDKETQARISYLEVQIRNLSTIIDSAHKSTEYKKAAIGNSKQTTNASDPSPNYTNINFINFWNSLFTKNETQQTSKITYSTNVDDIIKEMLSEKELNLLNSTDYKNSLKYQEITKIMEGINGSSNQEYELASIESLVKEILGEISKENKQ